MHYKEIIIWTMLKQIVVLLCFTGLAIKFEHWWIVLFSYLFLNINIDYNEKNVNKEE